MGNTTSKSRRAFIVRWAIGLQLSFLGACLPDAINQSKLSFDPTVFRSLDDFQISDSMLGEVCEVTSLKIVIGNAEKFRHISWGPLVSQQEKNRLTERAAKWHASFERSVQRGIADFVTAHRKRPGKCLPKHGTKSYVFTIYDGGSDYPDSKISLHTFSFRGEQWVESQQFFSYAYESSSLIEVPKQHPAFELNIPASINHLVRNGRILAKDARQAEIFISGHGGLAELSSFGATIPQAVDLRQIGRNRDMGHLILFDTHGPSAQVGKTERLVSQLYAPVWTAETAKRLCATVAAKKDLVCVGLNSDAQIGLKNTSGSGDGTSGSGDGTSGSGDGTSGSGDGTSGSGDGTSGSGDGTSGSGDGTSGSGDGTSGSGDGTSGSGDGTSGSGDGTSGSGDGTSGSGDGTSGSGDGTSGSGDGTSGSGDGTSGSTENTSGKIFFPAPLYLSNEPASLSNPEGFVQAGAAMTYTSSEDLRGFGIHPLHVHLQGMTSPGLLLLNSCYQNGKIAQAISGDRATPYYVNYNDGPIYSWVVDYGTLTDYHYRLLPILMEYRSRLQGKAGLTGYERKLVAAADDIEDHMSKGLNGFSRVKKEAPQEYSSDTVCVDEYCQLKAASFKANVINFP